MFEVRIISGGTTYNLTTDPRFSVINVDGLTPPPVTVNTSANAGDGSAWEFKLYDENGTVIRHRDLGYIYGIEPYESIASLLLSEKPEE